jgi:hypothetical protein
MMSGNRSLDFPAVSITAIGTEAGTAGVWLAGRSDCDAGSIPARSAAARCPPAAAGRANAG